MQGLRAIHQLNQQRAHEAVVAAEQKAEVARKQGHPKADEFTAYATTLRTQLTASPQPAY